LVRSSPSSHFTSTRSPTTMSSLSLRIMVLGPHAYGEYIRESEKGARLYDNDEYPVRLT
jgi:hypothetical protein